jgi:hypothetical protein
MDPDQNLTILGRGLWDLPHLDDLRGSVSLGNGCSHEDSSMRW